MTTALPGWHLGRNPIPYGRLALLVWLTTGFAVFALSYAATLDASFSDRANYEAGTDVRLVGSRVGFVGDIEGADLTSVYRASGSIRLSGNTAELLAVDPRTVTDVVFWREDFAETPLDQLFGEALMGGEWDVGVPLPDGVDALRLDAVILPETWARREVTGPHSPVRILARFYDDKFRLRTHVSDVAVTDEGWTTVTIDLDELTAREGQLPPAKQLTLQSIWMESEGPGAATLDATTLLVDDIRVVGPGGEVPIEDAVYETLFRGGGLTMDSQEGDAAARQFYSEIPEGQERPAPSQIAAGPLWRDGDVMAWNVPRRTRADAVPHIGSLPETLPFIADREAAANAGVSVGDTAIFGVGGETVDGTLVAIVDRFPTATDARRQGLLITRFDGLSEWLDGDPSWSLTGNLARRSEPQELWAKTDDPNKVVARVKSTADTATIEVISAEGVAADFSSRPIQVGLVSILFLGTGAGVVLALAGVTGYVIVAVRRRYREMGVLRALGLRRSSVAGTFAVEQLVVLGLGAAVGVVAGLGLMRLMLPFLQLGESATDIEPPALMVVEPLTLGIYMTTVVVLLVGSVLWATRSVSARKLSEVLREVER